MRSEIYWPGLSTTVKDFVRSCAICEQELSRTTAGVAPLQSLQSGYAFEIVGIDIVGPLPPSASGNKYLLVAVDHLSRWADAYPLQDIRAQTVAKVFVANWVSCFGVPERIHSDQGTQFESHLFAEMCRSLGVSKSCTTLYHPQGNGMKERVNRTLCNLLRVYAHDNPERWDEQIPYVLLSYRSSVH